MKRLIFLVITFVITAQNFAQIDSLNKLFFQANQLYREHRYSQAIELYESILKSGYEAAEVYYNLGNAYYRIGNLPKAILYYEKAYRLKPFDKRIRHNLEIARQFLQNYQEPSQFFLERFFKNLILSQTADFWAVVSMVSFAILLIFAFLVIALKNISLKRLFFYLSVLLFIVSATTFAFSLKNKALVLNSKEAIVMEPVSVKSAPSDDGTDLYIVNPGYKVKIISQQQGWYEVRLPNGAIGWIKADKVEKI